MAQSTRMEDLNMRIACCTRRRHGIPITVAIIEYLGLHMAFHSDLTGDVLAVSIV